jgi:hypothetical protein
MINLDEIELTDFELEQIEISGGRHHGYSGRFGFGG